MRDPILAERVYTDGGVTYRIRVKGGLHYIKGNSRPYFSITADIDRKGRSVPWVEDSGGCCHEEIEKRFPGKFSDLIALHLSDDTGEPMHSAANGLYWLAGLDPSGNGFGELYHGGSGRDGKSPADCLRIALNHFRCSEVEIKPVLEALGGLWFTGMRDKRRLACAALCESLRPRWRDEARAAIANHGLKVYGDEWHGTPGGLVGRAA